MKPDERAVLYENAKKRRDQGGQAIIDLIDQNGLSLSSGDMLSSDPDYLEMDRIIWSKEARAAAIVATDSGLPALSGVEPYIRAALGERYRPQNGGTVNAGYLTAGLMRHLGYVENGQGSMPDGSVAKTAMKWKLRSR
jgi:hypothetical protein